MEKFEYMHVVYNSLESLSRGMSSDLNRFGANGWEAYAVRTLHKNTIQIFLKRRISE